MTSSGSAGAGTGGPPSAAGGGTPGARAGRPPATNRADVLAAARTLIERDGWQRLTIRRLAAELGVGPTTIYRNVSSKQDLLLQLLDAHAARLGPAAPPADPRERIISTATATHEMLAVWPWAAEVLTVDGFVGLLSDSSLAPVEHIVAGALDHGCTEDEAVIVFRSIWYYTVGEILVRSHSTGAGVLAADDGARGVVESADLPRLTAIGARWPALAARDTYRLGLEALVDGLLAELGAPPAGP